MVYIEPLVLFLNSANFRAERLDEMRTYTYIHLYVIAALILTYMPTPKSYRTPRVVRLASWGDSRKFIPQPNRRVKM